jgi:hypothetical protein
MSPDDPGRTFVRYPDGREYEVAYRVRLLKDLPLIDGEPGDVANHAGEVLVMNAFDTVETLRAGFGKVIGDIVDGIRTVPVSDDERR